MTSRFRAADQSAAQSPLTTAFNRRDKGRQATAVILMRAAPLNSRIARFLGRSQQLYQLRWSERRPGMPHQVAGEFLSVAGAEAWASNQSLTIVQRVDL